MEKTIAAVATPAGEGGIAVIRISGEDAYKVAARVFTPFNKSKNKTLENAKGYTALFGHFIEDNTVLDEVIALCFRAPHSYTGEDVIELSCHGGSAATQRLLRAILNSGAEAASAGEFTKRALLNGRISLTQAEAVMDLIQAGSAQAAAAAAQSMEGALYAKIKNVQDSLITLAGHIAAYTDYPEEDVPELSAEQLSASLKSAKAVLDKLIDGYDAGAVFRRGVPTAIVGSPNVGKSTLLNLLAGFERAIVTSVAGTTRDVVEQEIMLGGVRLLLADTAGIRSTDDIVEAEGIRRSYERLERAGLILAVFDASSEITPADLELAEKCRGKAAVAILNKTDLVDKDNWKLDFEKIKPYFKAYAAGSAKDEEFSKDIENAVQKALCVANVDADALLLANERQLTAAKAAQAALAEALDAAQSGVTLDACGVCIDDALNALYSLTGQNASDDVIDEVFSKFCVGK